MTRWIRCGIGLLLVALPACIMVSPVSEKRVLTGSRITSEMTAPIQRGVTTRSEVIRLLGEPTLDLSAYRLIAYTWETLTGQMRLGGGPVGVTSRLYVLFIAFDAEDRVVKVQETVEWGDATAWERALKWAKREGLVGPTTPTPFEARIVPPGKSLLYLYREGGATDREDLLWPTPDVSVNGRLLGGLRPEEYRVLVVESGPITISVDALVRATLKSVQRRSSETTISIQALPEKAHYVKVRVQWEMGQQIPVLTECPKAEALPLLKDRTLAP